MTGNPIQQPTEQEKKLTAALVDHLRRMDLDVITDIEEGQRVLASKDKVRYFKTLDGEAYGFTTSGKTYIDPRIATAETPIHEYSHLWATAMRQNNPKEWKHIVELMKGCPIWEQTKKNYPDLTQSELADEVLAHYSGSRGAALLRDTQNRFGGVATGIIATFQSALRHFWKSISDMLGIHYTSAEEVADQVMTDMLAGKNVNEIVDQKRNEELRYSNTEREDLDTADDIEVEEENTRVRYARVAPTPLASTVYGAIADAEKRDNRFTLRYNKVNIGSKVLDIQFTEGLFIKKQSDSLPVGKPWPDDFPKAIIHTTQEKIYKDFGEEFKAAKAGDMEAARTIVRALIKPERIAALVSSYPDTIVAFPNKRKEDGNKMPAAYAEVLEQAGLRVDNSIRQIASPHHTGTVDLLRLFMRARFDGEIEQNANYLVIDDRLSSGGTARDLKDYIESKGGHVVAVSALTCSRNGTLMSQNDEIRRALQDLHITDKQLQDYGIATSVDCLTYGEASRLARLSKFAVERVSKEDLEARPEYKVIIAGGRHFDNYELLKEKCDYFLQDKVKTHRIVVVSGKASGADKLGERYAEEKGYEIEEHPANWEKNGRAAGPIRNAEMAKASNALIAFWDGESRGTQSMLNLAKKHNLEVATVKVVKLQEEYHWSDKTEVTAKQVLNKAIYMHDKMNEAITVYDIPEDKWKSKYPNPIDRLYKAISRYGEIEVANNTKEYRTTIEKMKLNGNTDNIKALHKTVGSTSIYFILPTDYNPDELQTAQKAKSVQTEQETEITETAEQHRGWHR